MSARAAERERAWRPRRQKPDAREYEHAATHCSREDKQALHIPNASPDLRLR